MLKIKHITKKVGFTKEQQTNMAELILNEINKNANIKEISMAIKEDFKNDFRAVFKDKNYKVINLFIDGISKEEKKEEFIINVINSKCKYTLYYDFKVFIEFLRRCGVSVSVEEKQAKIFEILSDKNGDIIELKDAYTNGNILINKEFITGKPEKETTKHEKSMYDFISNNLVKIESNNYKIEKNQKSNHANCRKEKYQIFYKNKKDDFMIFNQKFINALPCGCDLYFDKNNYNSLIAKKEEKIVALIMPVKFHDGLQSFELLPDIVEETETKTETETKEEKLLTALYNGSIDSEEYIAEKEKENEQKQNINIEHKNAVTGHVYSGNNAELLTNAMHEKNFTKNEWVASGQAKKLKKQIKENAEGVTIRIFYTDDDGRQFCKLEKIYNVDELEEIKKIETSSGYIDMINRLKAV